MNKEGILKVVAKTGGIKLADSDEWLNPTPEAKADVLTKLDDVKKLLGKLINLEVNDKGQWSLMTASKIQPKQEAKEVKQNLPDTKLKSMSLSYAKDLAVAGKIEVDKIIDFAEKFNIYLGDKENECDKIRRR